MIGTCATFWDAYRNRSCAEMKKELRSTHEVRSAEVDATLTRRVSYTWLANHDGTFMEIVSMLTEYYTCIHIGSSPYIYDALAQKSITVNRISPGNRDVT